MLQGEFEHEDSTGAKGRMKSGDVQWMKTAAVLLRNSNVRRKTSWISIMDKYVSKIKNE